MVLQHSVCENNEWYRLVCNDYMWKLSLTRNAYSNHCGYNMSVVYKGSVHSDICLCAFIGQVLPYDMIKIYIDISYGNTLVL